MAIIGVSKPKYAVYEYDEDTGKVTYSNGGTLGKMTQVDLVINTSEDNNLFADNGLAEADRQFTDGTLTVGTDDLSQSVSRAILGAVEEDLEPELLEILNKMQGGEDFNGKELIYDDRMETPYLGQGFIIKRQKDNAVSWRAVMLTKTIYNVPDESAVTQGESIEWQTPELVAAVMRDDSATHRWKRDCMFPTEEMAEVFLDYRLGIKSPLLERAMKSVATKKTTVSAGSEKV